MIVEPAVADSITGSEFNDLFLEQDGTLHKMLLPVRQLLQNLVLKSRHLHLITHLVGMGSLHLKKQQKILEQKLFLEEFADPAATDFTSNLQKIIDAKPDYLFVVWAGANSPWNQIADLKMQEKGIKISTGAPDIPALIYYGTTSRNGRILCLLSYASR